MTDSTERIDPRYDPRFQRGYVGSDADATPHADAPPPTSPVVAPVPVTRVTREPVESRPVPLEPDRAPVPEPEALAGRVATTHAGTPADSGQRTAEPAEVGALEAPGDAGDAGNAGDAGSADVGPADPRSAGLARAWLIGGWLFSGLILAGGIWWAWTAAIDPRYYTGFGAADSDAFMYLQWSVPPSMVMIGALGAVVVTTIAGMQQLAASAHGAVRAVSAFPRVPAAYALVGIAVAGLIATFWLGGLVADGQAVMWTDTGPREDQLTTVALSRVGEVGVGPIAACALAAVIGLVALGVESARPMRPARGAR